MEIRCLLLLWEPHAVIQLSNWSKRTTIKRVPVADSLPAKPKSKRILELDAIRALACLNLLLFHFTYVYQNKYGFNSPLGFTFPYGKYGVQLFFMLSGLVNAMTLLSKRKPGEFIVARCLRIVLAGNCLEHPAVCLATDVSSHDDSGTRIGESNRHAATVWVFQYGTGDLDVAD